MTTTTRQTSKAALVCLLAALALSCRRDDVSGDAADVAGPDEDEDGDDDGDGDGDGDRKPFCDLTQISQMTPEWIVVATGPIDGGAPSVSAIDVTDDAIYAAGVHDVSDAEPPGFFERRTLDGALEWTVELPKVRGPFVTIWDGSHLYGSFGHGARRWTAEGVEEGWRFDAEFIADMEVGDDSVAIVGTFSEPGGRPDYTDAYFGRLTKTVPPSYAGAVQSTPGINDQGDDVAHSPWGGWLAAGHIDGALPSSQHTWLRGFDSSSFDAAIGAGAHTATMAMFPHQGALVVVGRSSKTELWIAALTESGEELWRNFPSLCAGAGFLWQVVAHDDWLWGIGSVSSGPSQITPLLVKLSFDGVLEDVYAIPLDAQQADLWTLDANDTGVYVGGHLLDVGDYRRVIGRVNP